MQKSIFRKGRQETQPVESYRGGYGAQGGAAAAGALREHTIEKVRCRGGGAQKKGGGKIFAAPGVNAQCLVVFWEREGHFALRPHSGAEKNSADRNAALVSANQLGQHKGHGEINHSHNGHGLKGKIQRGGDAFLHRHQIADKENGG